MAKVRLSRDCATMNGCRNRPLTAVAVTEAMLSGFIWILPWPMKEAAVSASRDSGGTLPSTVTMPVCQTWPIPKYCLARCPARCRASCPGAAPA